MSRRNLTGCHHRRPRRRFHHHHDVAAEDGRKRLAAALGRYVRELDAGLARHQLHGDGIGGGGTDRGVGELAGVGLGELDDVLPLLEGAVGHDDGAQAVAAEQDDVGEVLDGIEARLLHVGHAVDRDRQLRDGVAVGLGVVRHRGGAQRGAAARLVVDDHRLSQVLRGALGDAPEQQVCRQSRSERDDQRDRLRRECARLLEPRPEPGNPRGPQAATAAAINSRRNMVSILP